MARKKGARRSIDRTAAAPARSASLPRWLVWGSAIWLLLLARTPFAFVTEMQLVSFPDRSLLGESTAWNPPLAYAAAVAQLNEIPYWLGAAFLALLLAVAIRWKADSANVFLLGAGVIGLVLVGHIFPLVDVLCLFLIAFSMRQQWRYQTNPNDSVGRDLASGKQSISPALLIEEGKHFALAVVPFILAVFSSLEFGLIALLSCGPLAIQTRRLVDRSAWQFALTALFVATTLVWLPGLAFDGYYAALLRPFNWAWLDIPIGLLPRMVPIWHVDDLGWGYVLLILPLLDRWRQAILGRVPVVEALVLVALTLIAFGCGYYAWLVAAAIVITPMRSVITSVPEAETAKRRYLQGGWVMLGLAVCGAIIQVTANGTTMLASDAIHRVMDPANWDLRGRVLLSNLEQTSDWQQPRVRDRYKLILTDRWDVHHANYLDYFAVVEDWTHWRRQAYLRTDGEWGGYHATFQEWDPTMIVVDADNLPAIHRHSVNSGWSVIGVDHEKTVFVESEQEDNQSIIQYAGQMLTTLELPRPGVKPDFQRVLAVGSRADSRQVSAILTALRLPYAALRVLPEDDHPATRAATVYAWCELGHRSHRYAGQYSLLDCYRAFSVAELEGPDSLVAQTEHYRRTLAAAIRAEMSEKGDGDASLETVVRNHLLLGETAAARERCAQLSDPGKSSFYGVISECDSLGNEETIARLRQLVASLSGPLQAECWFYIGTLAVEEGDFLLARSAFAEVGKSGPATPFSMLAEFYLSRL